jgi:cytochrome oxidase Cu insertion factor (SCO1/SenC/PrrC family)
MMALKLKTPGDVPSMRPSIAAPMRFRVLVEPVALSLVLAGAAILFYWHHQPAPAQLVGGAIVNERPPAPGFALSDQFGAPETMSAFRGRPIALTFLYTDCPDVCPLIASNLHETYKQLGNLGKQVQLMAVTVDPEHDTTDKIRQFSAQRGLTDELLFLNGSREELASVWGAYHITAQADTQEPDR